MLGTFTIYSKPQLLIINDVSKERYVIIVNL